MLQANGSYLVRLLWLEDFDKVDKGEYTNLRFLRVHFGVISSPFLLAVTLQLHLEDVGTTPTALNINYKIYDDNVVIVTTVIDN